MQLESDTESDTKGARQKKIRDYLGVFLPSVGPPPPPYLEGLRPKKNSMTKVKILIMLAMSMSKQSE